jgi:ribosome maturation factor RimP
MPVSGAPGPDTAAAVSGVVAILGSIKYTELLLALDRSGRAPTFLFLGSRMAQPDLGRRESPEGKISALAGRVAASIGMELILVEVKRGGRRSLVRIFIDQPGGVSLDDCERFSRRFSVLLDVEDWIPDSYVLEVSSPGLDRPLINEADFRRFADKKAKIRLRNGVEGQRNFRGRILGVTEGRLGLEVAPGREIEIDLADIDKANLEIEL